MTIEEKISTFINDMNYINNEHCLGVLFYGSYLTGFSTADSDIDLHIIFDNSDPNRLIRGNKIVDGTRVEYFEKPISDIYLTIDNDYQNQNNASLTIFGKSKIIYERDNQLKKMQQYVTNKFSNPLPPLSENEAKEQVSIINNRMEKLEKYAIEDNPYFEHLYHLTIDKVRRFYHNLMGMPRVETSKCFKLYTDEKYQKAFCINKIPEQCFIDMYFKAISDNNLSKLQKYQLIKKIYEFAKRNVILDNNEHRILIKSRNIGFSANIIEPNSIDKKISIPVDNNVLKKILKFIKEMNYINNEHCLGVIVYGSSLTGFNTKNSDIDLHIIFDDYDANYIIRGSKIIDGTKIEYFEKPIKDVYLSIENGYLNQNNAFYSMIGNGTIIFEKNNKLSLLKQYALDRFKGKLPKLGEEEIKEQISIINNRMEKLEKLAINDDNNFNHLYHLAIDKIRKFYHKALGISKIQTSKVYRIYTDEEYRKSMYKENPEQEFVDMYLNLITTDCKDKMKKFQMLNQFYKYTTRNIDLGDNYRIFIKSRNVGNISNSEELESKPYLKKLSINRNK